MSSSSQERDVECTAEQFAEEAVSGTYVCCDEKSCPYLRSNESCSSDEKVTSSGTNFLEKFWTYDTVSLHPVPEIRCMCETLVCSCGWSVFSFLFRGDLFELTIFTHFISWENTLSRDDWSIAITRCASCVCKTDSRHKEYDYDENILRYRNRGDSSARWTSCKLWTSRKQREEHQSSVCRVVADICIIRAIADQVWQAVDCQQETLSFSKWCNHTMLSNMTVDSFLESELAYCSDDGVVLHHFDVHGYFIHVTMICVKRFKSKSMKWFYLIMIPLTSFFFDT